ncbi:glutamyl aminopeptidase-like isoform X2 [Linepithema humile]|uniref:glutamyl aminopeptidase-like isoform X2 n=1 Tax=Linepithema humile TaxID=83485 RepID=UPI00351DB122
MALQKFLLNGGLVLIAMRIITLSNANNTEYGQIANNTQHTQYKLVDNNTLEHVWIATIPNRNNTEPKKILLRISQNTKHKIIPNNTAYNQVANKTKYKRIANNTEYQEIANDMPYEQIANNTKYKQDANNAEYDTKYTEINSNLSTKDNDEYANEYNKILKLYQQITNNTKHERIANNAEYKQVANNTEYDTKYTEINSNLSTIVPFHYNVEILLYFKDNLLFGECSININISRQLEYIKLNSVPIRIIEATLIANKNTSVYQFSSFTNYNNILTINFDEEVSPDTYTLNVTYMRVIHKDRNSIQSVYQDKLGDKMLNQIGVEVMKAHQLFPCKDELTSNSTIKIAIKHDEKYTVLSNMPIRVRNKAANSMMWTDFDESLPMPVQRISFVITTFTNVSSQFANVTIWCRPSVWIYVLYAKDVLEKVVPYFKEKYMLELSKLDIVAVWHRHDYNTTTLGLIFLREADIIYNEDLHSVIRRREVAHVIARQLVFHWCNDVLLWSKESFAAFFGAYILDQIYQNDHMMDLMVVQTQQDSFRYDTSSTADYLPLESRNNSEINSIGSPSNYMKSFLIWRTLSHLITDVFWINLRTYINRHRFSATYSNMTTSNNLWITMQILYNKIYSKDFLHPNLKKGVITNWKTKKYYFVLYVTQQRSLNTVGWEIKYIRSPYLSVNDKTKIWIHVTYMLQRDISFDKNKHSFWLTLDVPSMTFLDGGSNITNWIIVNIQLTGYYRVNYDVGNWQQLMRYLNSEDYNKIHILNRAQIIDDAFYFFVQKQLRYNLFWNLTNFVIRDTNFVTWYPMIKVFESFTYMFPLEYGNLIMEAMKNRIDGLLTKIGYFDKPTDHTLTIYLRQEAVKWACILGISECRRNAASKLLEEFKYSEDNSNSMEIKRTYCHNLIPMNHTIWNEIWKKWNATFDERFLEYLSCSEDLAIIRHYLTELIQRKAQSEYVNAFFFSVAKHAKKVELYNFIFNIVKEVTFDSNRRSDIIATFIVIITHVHEQEHISEVYFLHFTLTHPFLVNQIFIENAK